MEAVLIEGIFEERASDVHVGRRKRMLGYPCAIPDEIGDIARCPAKNFAAEFARNLKHELRERGLVSVALDQPLPTEAFAEFAGQLGAAKPETDPATAPFVERDIVLNLITRYGETDDVSLQPFASGFLTLHSENSAQSIEQQSRYIVLMCCEPGDARAASSTVLVSMQDVESELDPRVVATLAATRYLRSREAPMIARRQDGRHIFSFRDFWRQPLEWLHCGAATDSETVDGAIRGLLAGMYGASARAVTWTRGLMVIIDNHFFFHGKTQAHAVSGRPRHLKRLRIR